MSGYSTSAGALTGEHWSCEHLSGEQLSYTLLVYVDYEHKIEVKIYVSQDFLLGPESNGAQHTQQNYGVVATGIVQRYVVCAKTHFIHKIQGLT